jgi:hypothetical protein
VPDKPTIGKELRELCAQRATGHYSIVSNDGPRAKVMLEGGEITTLSYHGAFVGRRALDAILAARLRGVSTKFTAMMPGGAARDDSLPPTAEILKALSGDGKSAGTPVEAGYERRRSENGDPLSTAMLGVIRKVIVDHVGPAGAFILDDCLQQDVRGESIDALLERLAGEVPAAVRERFAEAVKDALAKAERRHPSS